MPHAGCRMPDSGCQPRRGVMFVELRQPPPYRRRTGKFIEAREFIFRRCRRRGVFEGATGRWGDGAMERLGEGAKERGGDLATGRRGDGATGRGSDGETRRKCDLAMGDGDTVVQSCRSEIRTQGARHRTQGTGRKAQDARHRTQGAKRMAQSTGLRAQGKNEIYLRLSAKSA